MTKEEAKKIFGENLKKIRIARGMSQEELALKLGYVNRSSINKIEVGRSDMPRSKIALAAKILGVSPLELFKNDPFETEPELTPDFVQDGILIEVNKLNDKNKELLKTYLKALLDSQEGN